MAMHDGNFVWCNITKYIHAQLGSKINQQFSSFSTKSNGCLHAGKVLGECKNNNKTQLINLDLQTQRSFVCVCRAPRLALMKHIDREHMLEKATERCLITVVSLKPYIRTPVALRRRYTLAFFTGTSPSFVLLHAWHLPPMEQVSGFSRPASCRQQ